MKCSFCGKDFEPTPAQLQRLNYGKKWGRKNVYCSMPCVHAAAKERWSEIIGYGVKKDSKKGYNG